MVMGRRKKLPFRPDPTENADQAELSAFLKDSAPTSCGIIDERLASADDDYRGDPELKIQDWEREKGFEEAANAVNTEIDRRVHLLGANYPFIREGSHLTYSPSSNGLYEYLLCLSLAEDYSTGRRAIATRTFEAISCIIAEAYLGEDSASYRMGWPRPKNKPSTFKACVEDLRKVSGNHPGEWRWGPKENNIQDPSPATIKEQGLDIVAWKLSIDGRPGQFYLLGQCACGKGWKNDNKLRDLDLPLLKEWISEIASVAPARAIFTPRHALDTELPLLSRHGGIVFDRTRITLLGERAIVNAHIEKRPKSLSRLCKMALYSSNPKH